MSGSDEHERGAAGAADAAGPRRGDPRLGPAPPGDAATASPTCSCPAWRPGARSTSRRGRRAGAAASRPAGVPARRRTRRTAPAIVMRTGEPELVRRRRAPAMRPALAAVRPAEPPAAACSARSRCSRTERATARPSSSWRREIARRTAAAIEIERSEQRYRMLFEASPMPMWVYDAETLAFLAVNDAAVRHYGYSRDEFLAMTINDIRPPEDVPALLADVKARGGPGSPAPKTWRHRRKDGSLIDVEITAGRITFEGRARRARARARRQRAQAARAAARRRREDGGDRAPRGRRRARLQQPADGDRRLRRDPARARRRRGAATEISPRRRARPPRSPASCWPSAAARCCTRACSTSTRSSPAWSDAAPHHRRRRQRRHPARAATSRRSRPTAPRSSG